MRILAILLGCTLLCSYTPVGATALGPLLQAAGFLAPDTPSTATDFELSDSQGKTFRLQEQRGKVLFINFWATWCPPCVHEMPMMEQLRQTLQQQPVRIWAINMQESREAVARFMTSKQFHFPALLDHQGEVTAAYQVRGLPTTYLLDCAGNVIGHVIGVVQWMHDATRALVSRLLTDSTCRQATGPAQPDLQKTP